MMHKYVQSGFMLVTLLGITVIISIIIGIVACSHNFLYGTMQQFKIQEQRYRAVEGLILYGAALCNNGYISSDHSIEKTDWLGLYQKGTLSIHVVPPDGYTITACIYEQNKVTYAVIATLKQNNESLKIISWQYASGLIT